MKTIYTLLIILIPFVGYSQKRYNFDEIDIKTEIQEDFTRLHYLIKKQSFPIKSFKKTLLNGVVYSLDSLNNLEYEKKFSKGKLKNRKLYWKNGQLFKESNYVNDKKEGISKLYNENGQLKEKFDWSNGQKKEGISKEYYENGQLEFESNMFNKDKEGITKIYYENGDLFFEGNFIKDELGGFYKFFNENGQLIEESDFLDDKKEVLQKIEPVQQQEEIVDEIFMVIDDMPLFKGCSDENCTQTKIMQFIARNTKYPPIAKENNITGRVWVSFVVCKTGFVSNVNIIRGVDTLLDYEAFRVIKSLPRFQPALQNGEQVRVQYNIPIYFKLK